MANQSGRPVAPARKLMAAVLGTIAVFVMLFGLGLSSWSIVALGVALLALAIALSMVNVVRRGARAWVAGTVQVKAVSQPPASSVYGRAELSVVVIAPGLPIQEVTIRDPRVPVEKWPRPGDTLPVSVDVDDMRRVRIDWDEAPSRADSADLNPPPPAYDVDDEDIEDDDLLGDVEPPPWATRDRQWGLGPDEPPPPPAPAPRSGDMDDVVVHDTPAGPIVEGQLVGADEGPSPLPQRARPARSRPSPHPRAATATVEPETEAPELWSDSGAPEERPAAAPAPGQRQPGTARPGGSAAEQPVTAARSAPSVAPDQPAEAESARTEPRGAAARQTVTEPRSAASQPTVAEPQVAASPQTVAEPQGAASRPAVAEPDALRQPVAEPRRAAPREATAEPQAARVYAEPARTEPDRPRPASPEPQVTRAYAEPQPVRPYSEPQPDARPATEPDLPPAASGDPETHDPDIDLALDSDPEPAPEPPPTGRSLYLSISIPGHAAGDVIPPPADDASALADDGPAHTTRPAAAGGIPPAGGAWSDYGTRAAADDPATARSAPSADSGSPESADTAPGAPGAEPRITPVTAFSMPGPSTPPYPSTPPSSSTPPGSSASPAESTTPAPAGPAAHQGEPDDGAAVPDDSAAASEGGDDAAAGAAPRAGRSGSPWADLEGGFEPDERADDLITAYPSARPGPAGAIHGVGITVLVTNLERSITFYRDILGFFEIDSSTSSAVLASGDTRLVLRTVHDLSAAAGRLIYLNLEVGDVEAVYQELKAKGVPFVHGPRPVNRGDKLELWAAAFSDPDRHNIAITQWRAIR